jgi:hypothetical protein
LLSTLQLHQGEDYVLRRPLLSLGQLVNAATHVTVTVTADPADPVHHPADHLPLELVEAGAGEALGPGDGEGGGNGDDAAAAGGELAALEADVPQSGSEGSSEDELDGEDEGVDGPTLVLSAPARTLVEAMDALTASRIESIDVEAPEVLFTDELGASFTGSR